MFREPIPHIAIALHRTNNCKCRILLCTFKTQLHKKLHIPAPVQNQNSVLNRTRQVIEIDFPENERSIPRMHREHQAPRKDWKAGPKTRIWEVSDTWNSPGKCREWDVAPEVKLRIGEILRPKSQSVEKNHAPAKTILAIPGVTNVSTSAARIRSGTTTSKNRVPYHRQVVPALSLP